MSITIKIDDFHSWSEIFLEIERQTNLKTFAAIAPDITNVDRQERRPRSLSLNEPERKEVKEVNQKRCGRRKSIEPSSSSQMESQRTHKEERRRSEGEAIRRKRTRSELQPRARIQSTPCPMIDADTWLRDPRLTDAARKLSKEQMALLYEDIFKPLDVYSILCQRRAQIQKGDEQ